MAIASKVVAGSMMEGAALLLNRDERPTLYRTAGKQILEGAEHYADARDEVAAAVIAKALNRS